MLGRYIKINGEVMPNPVEFSYTYPPDENVFTSEAGTRLSNVKRLDRLTFSATWHCSSMFSKRLIRLCQTASVSVSIDDEDPVDGSLRLSGGPKLVKNSESTPGTQGLWQVDCTFEGE